MRKLIEWIKGLFASKRRLKERVRALEESQKMLWEKVGRMDEFVQSAREIQTKKNLGIPQKQKWLRGYPDQTKEKKGSVDNG